MDTHLSGFGVAALGGKQCRLGEGRNVEGLFAKDCNHVGLTHEAHRSLCVACRTYRK